MVGLPLFIERALQDLRVVIEPEELRVRPRAAVARHLVMLDPLRRR